MAKTRSTRRIDPQALLNVERLLTVLDVIAMSDRVKNGIGPLSAMLIAPSDAGKTQLLLSRMPPDARVLNDFTFGSLLTVLAEPNPPHWIVVPDFNAVISHKPAVASLAMALLLGLLAEGVTEIPGIEGPAKLKLAELKTRGVRISMLTAITPQMFVSRRGKWRDTGLLRRLIPIYYSYRSSTISDIQRLIERGVDRLSYDKGAAMHHAKQPCNVMIPDTYAHRVMELSSIMISTQLVVRSRTRDGAEKLAPLQTYPFSLHKVLRTYIRAHALLHRRRTVTEADWIGLQDFTRFVRYDHPEEL
jgi:hypothetical protein